MIKIIKAGMPFVGILLWSLVPRLLALDAFLSLDEYLWLDRSRHFLLALKRHDWARTFQTGHPGVTTMWAGGLGLWLYGLRHGMMRSGAFVPFLQGLTWDHQRPDLLPYLRMPIAVVTALGVVGVAYLLMRLFDRRVGLIGGLLLGLDPWYLAHSRFLHHDALMVTFMTLSALALLLYVWRDVGRWALFLSGICAGLALLSKALALFLLPWAALLFLIALWLGKDALSRILPRTLADGAMWTMTTWLAFFVPWPALWLRPANTLLRIRQMVTTYAINPHAKGQFFLGQRVADPGWGFYPLVALFAMTPLVMLGLAALPLAMRHKSPPKAQRTTIPLLLLGVYAIAYTVSISLGEKKQDRYLLAVLVMLNVIAAVGLRALLPQARAALARGLARGSMRASSWLKNSSYAWLLLPVAIVQAVTCLPHHPYYLTYYNPLVGGNRVAARALLVGWGEGNERAAAYLNQLPNADELTVVASMAAAFAPFFKGRTLMWWPPSQAFRADYVVLHRKDVQQGQIHPHLMTYIRETWPLERMFTLHGLPYTWIYRAPRVDWALPAEDTEDAMGRWGLMAYRVWPQSIVAGQGVTVALYVQPGVNGRWAVRLQGETAYWGARCRASVDDAPDVNAVWEEICYVDTTSTIQPGTHHVEIGFRRESEAVPRWLALPSSPRVHVGSREDDW